jgi:hypothetical protein
VHFPLTSDKIQEALERGGILAPDGEEEEIVTKTTRPCEKSGLLTIAAGEAHISSDFCHLSSTLALGLA